MGVIGMYPKGFKSKKLWYSSYHLIWYMWQSILSKDGHTNRYPIPYAVLRVWCSFLFPDAGATFPPFGWNFVTKSTTRIWERDGIWFLNLSLIKYCSFHLGLWYCLFSEKADTIIETIRAPCGEPMWRTETPSSASIHLPAIWVSHPGSGSSCPSQAFRWPRRPRWHRTATAWGPKWELSTGALPKFLTNRSHERE